MARRVKLKPGDLVLVSWNDAHGPSTTWEHRNELDCLSLCECESIGWVVDESSAALRLASHRATERGQLTGLFVIPQETISKVQKLR